jgi:hypothetical protein
MKLKDLMKQAQNALKAYHAGNELTPYQKELCRKFAEVQGLINEMLSYDEDVDEVDKFEDIDILELYELEKQLLIKIQEEFEVSHA